MKNRKTTSPMPMATDAVAVAFSTRTPLVLPLFNRPPQRGGWGGRMRVCLCGSVRVRTNANEGEKAQYYPPAIAGTMEMTSPSFKIILGGDGSKSTSPVPTATGTPTLLVISPNPRRWSWCP